MRFVTFSSLLTISLIFSEDPVQNQKKQNLILEKNPKRIKSRIEQNTTKMPAKLNKIFKEQSN